LLEFYQRVDPPGFWRHTAEKLYVDARHPLEAFKEGAYLTLTTSLSVYFLLVGFGKLILPDPQSSMVHPWIYIFLGLASVGLWWRKFVSHTTGSIDR
jgi:SSS family solute:Na+ symporter